MLDLIRRIEAILMRLARLESMEFSRVVSLSKPIRILDDLTARAAGYTITFQISGVGGLPSKITGVWIKTTLIAATAATTLSAAYDNPDDILGANSLSGYASGVGNLVTGLAFCQLSSTGTIKYSLSATSGGTGRVVYDVVAYII